MSKLVAATVVLGSLCGSAMLFTAGCMSQAEGEPGSATSFATNDADAAPPARGSIVISEVYGSGGITGASHRFDYVELFNKTSAPITLDGLSLQTDTSPTSATGNFARVIELTGTIKANGYFLVKLASSNESIGADLPTADQTADVQLGAKDGKVALVPGVAPLNCGGSGALCATSKVLDMVGWGASSQQEGTTSVPAQNDAKKAAARKGKGCTDTENNASDFEVVDPNPENSEASFTCPAPPRDAGAEAKAPAPVLPDPELGPESEFDAGVRKDAGAPTAAQGASDDCAVGNVGGPSGFMFAPLAGLALAALAFARRRRA